MAENKFFKLFKKNKSDNSTDDQSSEKIMVVGLGNPGPEYQKNRHNVGFMAIDHISSELGFTYKKAKSKAIVMEGKWDGRKIILVKPQTFMNLSGTAVSSLARFYKIGPEKLIVIHDDLDLPALTLRLRPGGGPGGQKGVASIIQNLGTQQFNRVRVGIGRPPGRMDPSNYVLQNFSKQEEKEIPFLLDTVFKAVKSIIECGIEISMNNYNGENGNKGDPC